MGFFVQERVGMGTIIFRNEEQILFESKKEKMRCYAEDVIPLFN